MKRMTIGKGETKLWQVRTEKWDHLQVESQRMNAHAKEKGTEKNNKCVSILFTDVLLHHLFDTKKKKN